MTDERATRNSSGTFWAWVPAGLLGSMLLGLGTLAYIAADDPGFALEPNYYDKAVHWDQTRAEERASKALGFHLELERPLSVTGNGSIELGLSLRDRQGLPISGAALVVEAFANAAASRVEHVVLREVSPGIYRGQLRRGASGLWELRCQVSRGNTRYRQVLRRDVAKGDSA